MPRNRAVIVTPIPKEFDAICELLDDVRPESHDRTTYRRGTLSSNGSSWDILVVECGQGNAASALETGKALSYFKPDVTILSGIAGGIKDVEIGHVIAANQVLTYEFIKIGNKEDVKARPCGHACDYGLIQIAKEVRRSNSWLKWLSDQDLKLMPEAREGTIVSGEKLVASRHAKLVKFIKINYNQAIALEMEGFGFLSAAHAHGIPALVVRGTSDLLSGKSKSDKKGSQELASRCASAFTIEVLTHWSPEGFRVWDDHTRSDKPINVPELPKNFIPREDYLKAIKKELLSSVDNSTTVKGKQVKADSKLGIQGMAGIGKTVFAAAVAQDQEIISHFKDGIFWITLGTTPNIILRQSDLAKMLGAISAIFEDVQQGKNHLSRLMAKKKCLLVLDDVWNVEDVEAFWSAPPIVDR